MRLLGAYLVTYGSMVGIM